MSKANGAEDDTLRYWLTAIAPTITRPTAWWIALYTSDPLDDNSGDEVDAVVDDTAYARQTITFADVTTQGQTENNLAAIFAAVVLGSGAVPYTVTHFGIFDAVTAGNLIHHGPLCVPKELDVGDQANFATGDIIITED